MICVDASVAAKWLLGEEHSEKADALYVACIQQRHDIVAPPLLPVEITNILRQRMRRQDLSLTAAQSLLTHFRTFPVTLQAPETLHQDALTLAATYVLPAAYDAHYVALARHIGCPLWTDDQRLLRLLAGRLPFVRSLSDYLAGESPV